MKLTPIKANMTEVEIGNKTVLFSYKTPVAYQVKENGRLYQTNKKWSKTTSTHIKQWLSTKASDHTIEYVDQDYINGLV